MPLPVFTGDASVRPHASLGIALEMGFQQCIEQFRKILLSTPLGWIFVAWLAWREAPRGYILGWIGLFAVLWIAALSILTYLARRPVTIAHDKRLLYLAASLDALGWGCSLFFMAGTEHIYLLLLVVICGVTALQAPTLISHIRAYRFHSMALYIMVAANAVYRRDDLLVDPVQLMVGVGLFIVLIHFGTNQAADRIIQGLQLQFENAMLTEQLRDNLRMAKRDASTDALTGLANRRQLDSTLATWQNRIVHSARRLSVLMVDIDHFKQINDTYGHEIGDRVLQAFAEHVRKLLRSQDLFARHGGEEFVILLPDTTAEAASVTGDRIRASLEIAQLIDNPPIQVTVSIGVAQHQGNEPVDTTMARADAAAYSAKHLGRNKVHMAA